jgi:HlyD family secretion protein
MKKLALPLIMSVLAVAAFAFRDHWLPQTPGQLHYLGYAEGELLLIGAPQHGRIAGVKATKGQPIMAGSLLFELDAEHAASEVARAEAAVKSAQAMYHNLLTGQRPQEIAVIHAQIAQTEAGLELARKRLRRASTLANSGTAAQAQLDEATQQVNFSESRLVELRASEQVAKLPARPAEVDAASARITEALAQLDMARASLSDLSLAAPVDAIVDDVFFEAGEWVGAGQPVVSLMKPSDLTLRFFVPEGVLAKAAPGTEVSFRCSGCGESKKAVISHTASEPEYAPPVIYSGSARARLIYLVEAKLKAPDPQLRPGIPIEVEPLQ